MSGTRAQGFVWARATLLALCVLSLGAASLGATPVLAQPGPSLELSVSTTGFSPNGDGVKDSVRITAHVGEAATVTLAMLGKGGRRLAHADLPTTIGPKTQSFRWSGGTGPDGVRKVAPDGTYLIRAVAVATAGGRAVASTPVLLDTRPPVIRWGRVQPARVVKGPLHLHVRVVDAMDEVRVRVAPSDQDGTPLRRAPRLLESTGAVSVAWQRASRLAPGGYKVALTATDGLGNSSISTAKPFLVDHAVRSHVWGRFSGAGRHVALTFDDCNFSTAWASILSTLDRYHLKGSFFCPGRQVLAAPSLARRTVASGHTIGSHGWDHAYFPGLSYGGALSRLVSDREVWWTLAHVAPTPYFRPPYGAYTSSTAGAAGAAGYGAMVLWDVDPKDWSSPGTGAIIERVVSHTRPGSIVLMHVVPQTAAALPTIIQDLRARHLLPVSLAELARLGTPSPGGWPS